MPENQSRAGKVVERMRISDEPHQRYSKCHPVTGEELKRGIPILTKADGGNVIRKDVTYYTVKCPDCRVPARYNNESEPICPECGMICSSRSAILSEQMVRDGKAAGRATTQNSK